MLGPDRPTFGPDIATIFLRWSWLRAALHRGYWLITSLYLVVDTRLSPFQLVLIGVAQAIVSLVFEIPTGVMADTISRKWSLVIFHILVGMSMVWPGHNLSGARRHADAVGDCLDLRKRR